MTKREPSGPAGAEAGRRIRLAIWAGALALFAVGGAALLLAPQAPPHAPVPAEPAAAAPDPAVIAEGERLYAAACASCHGANLEGQPDWQQRKADGKLPAPPHDATGHSWHHPDEHLFAITKYGLAPFAGPDYATDMPAFENQLTDDEIRAVIEFIKSRWPEEIRAHQAQIDAQARAQQSQ
jgi:mono/diheme cytochrome c family protein